MDIERKIKALERLKHHIAFDVNCGFRHDELAAITDAIDTIKELSYKYNKALHDVVVLSKENTELKEQLRISERG